MKGNSNLVDDIERGVTTPRDLYGKFVSEFGYQGDYADFGGLLCGHFSLKRDSAALFRVLARRYPVYLLSNINDLHYQYLRRRYPFLSAARGTVLSYRLGLRKPEAAIYRAALKIAGAKAENAVFIDDLQENVAGAARLGITSIRFTDAAKLRQDLASLGLL